MDVFDVSTHAWQFVVLTGGRVLGERTQKPLAGLTGSLLYSSGFKKACCYASWTCKFVAFFVNEEALKMFIYIDAIQVSSTDFKISTYGFWICTLANAVPLYFPKKSVSRLFSFRTLHLYAGENRVIDVSVDVIWKLYTYSCCKLLCTVHLLPTLAFSCTVGKYFALTKRNQQKSDWRFFVSNNDNFVIVFILIK